MFTCHGLGSTNKLDCPHAVGTHTFSRERVKVISSHSAVAIAGACLPRTQADESSSQPWSACGAASNFRFTGTSSCRSMFICCLVNHKRIHPAIELPHSSLKTA